MAQLQSGAHVAPLDPTSARPAAGNGGVFLFSLLLAGVLGGFFAFPALTAKGMVFKWSSLLGANALPLGSVIFLCLCAVSALALLVFGLFIRSTLRGALYAILGLAGIGTMVFITLSGEGILAAGVTTKATAYLPDFSKIILGTGLQPQIQLLFVMGVALLFSVMIGAARARVLFPDNGSSKAWSAITALGLLAIVAVPVLMYKTYETWNLELIPPKWVTSGKDLMDLAALVIAAELTLLLILTSVFGLGGGRSSRGRGVFIMGIGMAIAIALPVYFYLTQVKAGEAVLLTRKFTDPSGDEAWKWIMAQKQTFLAGASVWAFFAMVGLGVSDLICQGQVKKLAAAGAGPESVKVTPTAGSQPAGQFNRAATLNPQQSRLEEIKKLYNAGLLSEAEFNRRRDEITGS